MSVSVVNAMAEKKQERDANDLEQYFFVAAREQGGQRHDLPLWALRPEFSGLETFGLGGETRETQVQKREIPDIRGGFQLLNVLSSAECQRLITLLDSLGFTEDGVWLRNSGIFGNLISGSLFGGELVDKGRRPSCSIVVPDDVVGELFQRTKALLPTMHGFEPLNINAKFRCYAYSSGDHFKPHRDGVWQGTRMVQDEVVEDAFGERYSQLTFLIFLNDDFQGGDTIFLNADNQPATNLRTPRGAVLCFLHGHHPDSPLHEGSPVLAGTKYVIRTEVMYSSKLLDEMKLLTPLSIPEA
eukprot:TRINITY_DN19721_c1_g1_i1.p1 TRINITY_DN19721_c1_g1~~TRINITY_DN19721_c1_g1_i1.p1  ORF type:complete len:299 (+),score=70.43 TRINITY_DN19721_c1_g1_i1:63-959(+)